MKNFTKKQNFTLGEPPKKVIFLVDSQLRGPGRGRGKGLSTKEKRTFLNVFFSFKFVSVLLSTKPRGGG